MNTKGARDSLLSENFSKRLKHVTVARQWVREQLKKVKHVRTHQQTADFFTKPLPPAAFKNCCNLFGLKTLQDHAQDQDHKLSCKVERRTAEKNEGGMLNLCYF